MPQYINYKNVEEASLGFKDKLFLIATIMA